MTTPGSWIGLTTITMLALAGCRALPATPLAQAALEGDVEAIRGRLAAGDRPGDLDAGGMAPLHWAARAGHVEAIRALVAAGADPDAVDDRNSSWTPLMHAVHKGQQGAVEALLEAGARPDIQGAGGATPLIMAAGYGQTGIVKRLLAAGADPREEGGDGITALWAAAGGATISDVTDGPGFGSCQPEVIAILRQAAPDLRIRRSLSANLLSVLSRSAECSRLLDELIE